MGKRTKYPPGAFSWVDLGTTDADGAKAFYQALFGWEAKDMPAGEGAMYTMLFVGDDAVGALYGQGDGAAEPPQWLSYVTVERADDAADAAATLGGSVLGQPFDVLDAGRMALLQDPTGAVFAVWEPHGHIGAGRVNDASCLCWNDLVTSDPDGAIRFYSALFRWEVAELDGAGGYRIIRNDGRSNGGVMPADLFGESGGSYWLAYFNAGDLDAALATATGAGGRVIAGPRVVPAGRFAVLADPQGAVFGLIEGEVDE